MEKRKNFKSIWKKILTTSKNYIIGAGHFCCTIRKTPTLEYVPIEYSTIGVSGNSEAIYLDVPFNKTGLWRLSSPKAYVWHMGNVLEENWSNLKINELKNFKEELFSFNSLPLKNRGNLLVTIIPYKLRLKLISILKKILKK